MKRSAPPAPPKNLLVRAVPAPVCDALAVRAAINGRSVSKEIVQILTAAVSGTPT